MKATRRSFLQMAGAGATALAAPNLARAQSLPMVRFAGAAPVVRADHAWMFLGIPMGYYEKLGFRGDYLPTAGSAAAVQLVLAGAAEVANSGFLELIATKLRQPNLPVHMFYSQERDSSYKIIVLPDSPIQKVADLKGKAIGVPSLASGTVQFSRGMLRRNGVDPKDVNILPIGIGPQALAALKGGQVDAISIFVGQIAAMESMGQQFRIFSAPIAGGGMVMSDAFVAKNPALAQGIYQGMILNQRIMLMNPEATVRAYWKQYGPPTGDADKALRDNVHLIKRTAETFQQLNDPQPYGAYTDTEWATISEIFGGEGGIPPGTRLSQFYDPVLVAEGNKVDLKLADEGIKAFAQ
jgi:NitT/TauT family transport system substrate-binding protein